ncbi:MAG: oligosaccharide flippase family protein [Bacteroidota bacterium]
MNNKLIKDISASTFQVILNQLFGLLVFIITSRYLAKSVYGELNWSLAILTFITTLLSLRLEQVVVRKVASGDDPSKILSIFLGHTIFFGTLFYIILLAGSFFIPSFFNHHSLLLILAVSHLLSFFSMPFKQLATGKEKYDRLAIMSSTANLIRVVWLVCIILVSSLDIQALLMVYIVSSVAELVISIIIVRIDLRIHITTKGLLKDYFILMRESLPQIGVVFLNACIARIDWILLGLFSTQVITAEYSFAYKVFELSPVPMLIIGPILLTRFSGYFRDHSVESLKEHRVELSFFIRAEMILATFLPLIINIIWTPLIDMLTQNKYGAVNQTTFLLLSLCIPFQYLINLFWTIHFSQNHLGLILRITGITCIVMVAGDLLLIPLINAKGAAIVYLISTVIEYFLYTRFSPFMAIQDKWIPLVACISIALISGLAVQNIAITVLAKLVLSGVIYVSLLIVAKQIRRSDIRLIRQWTTLKVAKFKI